MVLATPTSSPQDVATSELVQRLRADVLPEAVGDSGSAALVTGQTAFFEDISQKLPTGSPSSSAPSWPCRSCC